MINQLRKVHLRPFKLHTNLLGFRRNYCVVKVRNFTFTVCPLNLQRHQLAVYILITYLICTFLELFPFFIQRPAAVD